MIKPSTTTASNFNYPSDVTCVSRMFVRVALYLTVTHCTCSTTNRIESCERCRTLPERVCPRILSLESVDYFGKSDYFSGRKKGQT